LYERLTELVPEGFNAIFDGNAGPHFAKNFEHLAMHGKVVLFGNSAGMPPPLEPYTLVYRSLHLIGFSMRAITANPELYEKTYEQLLAWRKEGKWHAQIGHRFPLAEAMRAHQLLELRQNYGKIILTP
jgi:NADPH:quinone reductase